MDLFNREYFDCGSAARVRLGKVGSHLTCATIISGPSFCAVHERQKCTSEVVEAAQFLPSSQCLHSRKMVRQLEFCLQTQLAGYQSRHRLGSLILFSSDSGVCQNLSSRSFCAQVDAFADAFRMSAFIKEDFNCPVITSEVLCCLRSSCWGI